MSIKGSSKKLKISNVFLPFAVGTIIATALRIWQVFTIIEPDTGFYSEENATVWLLYGVLILTGIVIFAISYLAKEVPESRMPEGKNIPLAVFSAVSAGSLVVNALNSGSGFIKIFGDYQMTADMSMQRQTMASYMMKTGGLPLALESVCALLSAVYFVLLALKYFAGKTDIAKYKLLAVCPVFWATGRIVQRFTRTISFVNVSDLLLELFMLSFMMLFFLNLAQVNSNINARASMDKVFSYGLITAMLEIVISVPKLITLVVSPELNSVNNPLEICNIVLAVFTVLLLLAMLKIPTNKNITLKQAEKEAKEEKEEKEALKEE